MRVIDISVLAASLLFASCASQQHIAPRFVQPSTAPIQKAQAVTHTNIQKAQEIVKTLTITLPPDQTKIDALSQALNDAQTSNDQIEGARAALETQLKSQTDTANTLASNYDKAGAQIVGLQESRHGWVKRFWMASGLLLLAGLWIFKKPILAMVGGMGI
jgi:hypothetical protein